MFYEGSARPLKEILEAATQKLPPSPTIAVLVGSEGGFSPEEAAMAENAGIPLASLGPRILRCETAPLCAISAISYALGEY
jgi:16S rRNA (uracil1498-N3)-methyltransferase